MIAVSLKDLQLLKSKIYQAMQMGTKMDPELLPADLWKTISKHLYEAYRLVDLKQNRLARNLRKRGEKRK